MTFPYVRGGGMRLMRPMSWLVSSVLVAAVAFAPLAVNGQAAKSQKSDAAVAGATYVGQETCVGCHESVKTTGMHGIKADLRTPAGGKGCESCHGPGSKHADDPEKVKPMQFGKVSAVEASAACTSCHSTSEHAFWANSKHEARNVGCVSCHSVHSAKGDKGLKEATQGKLCASCHQAIANKLNRFNHMPVREDKMACSSCHNVHGSANVRMLRAGTNIDQSCTSCHQEKRGPFLWEHAPVANSCVTCHDPHGSSNDRMLVAKQPGICQRCHVTSRHPPTVYEGYLLKNSQSANKITGRSCLNCHQQIHGSNNPNGKAFLR
ncbi:MAG: DmsE family decaheme c-type cytochrome [Gemmatimonadaceae bacterium]